MKKVMFTLVALTLSMSMAYACGFNTGYIEWSQPNGVGFTACYWSDGFQTWMETDDGYRIFKGYDGWFYYAVLNSRGEFSPSDKKVGIDPPLASSYKLERSAERIAEIQAYKEAWNRGAEEGYQENLASSLDDPVTYKLGVVLVDFTPSARRTENENYPYGYTKALFDSMFFSRNHWIGDEFSTPPTPHPELEALFGSFADYYWEQSLETVQFEGRDGMRSIVNPDTLVNGYLIPRWVILDSSATYYDELGGGWPFGAYTLLHDMISAANAQLADVLGDSPLDSVFDKVGFITAGYTSLSGGNLRGGWTEYVGGKYYVCAEVYGWEGNPNYPAGFRHIGTHVHEFAHTIGLAHYNFYYPALYCRYFNLMGYGGNGPDYREACPSGFCPYARVEKLNYVEYDTIQTDTTLIISYNYDNPKYYLIKVPSSSQRFVLENRLREGFDLWTPNDANFVSPDPQNIDPNGNQGGLLIWRNRSHIDLLAADDVPYHERMVPDSDEDMLNLARDLFPYNQQDGAGSGLNFNDFTSPSSKISDEVFSHIAIQNITWDDVNKTTTVDIYFNAWKGNITENTTWDGDIYVYGNIFVNPGVTLTILPNTTIKFDGYYRLNVQGKLIAEGTLTNPITFCKIPSTQNWFGIMFEDSSNDSSVVKYCNIKDAYRGVSCIYASPTISNNTISNVTYGIYVSYSSATLSNNIINQNNSYGIYLYKSSSTTTNNQIENSTNFGIYCRYSNSIPSQPVLQYNTIENIYNYGIYCYKSSPKLFDNIIQDNGKDGVYCYRYSNAEFGSSNSDIPGRNVIRYNDRYGLYANYYSDVFLGEFIYFGPGITFGGYNSVYSNSSYEVRANYYCDVLAEKNWWGSYPPPSSEFYATNGSYIDYDFALDYDPNPIPKGEGTPGGNPPLSGMQSGIQINFQAYSLGDLLRMASRYRWSNNFDLAIQICEYIISASPDSNEAQHALAILWGVFRLSGMGGFSACLDSIIISYPDYEISGMASEILACLYVSEGLIEDALTHIQRIRDNFAGSEVHKYALFDLINIYLYEQGDLDMALETFSELSTLFPDDELVELAQLLIDDSGLTSMGKRLPESGMSLSVNIPEDYSLLQNYPNPFNTSTTIRYGLPEDSRVSVKIYNIIGQEVATLVNKPQDKGYYTVNWNANELASGIYILRIEAQALSQTTDKRFLKVMKMLLVK